LNKKTKNENLLKSGKALPVMETFYSIQGEGYMTGKPAWFIRIGGCDIGCKWCDIKESWNADVHPLIEIEDIIKLVSDNPSKTVVITGGEPLIYNLDFLCENLKDKGIRICLETSGSYPLTGSYDWICVSPKNNQTPRNDILLMADELKIIIQHPDDFKWAEKNSHKVKDKCLLYLQPEWSKHNNILPAIVDYIKQNPKWMVSLQTHKYMNIP